MSKKTKPHKWTEEQIDFFKRNIKGTHFREMKEMVNAKFGLDLTINQIRGFANRNNLKNGIDMCYKKDLIPWNKGMKGLQIGGKSTQFKKGQTPQNYKPVGSERVDNKDGYTLVKVKDEGAFGDRWRHKHVVEWEKHHGKVPNGYTVIFLDGNKENITISNLEMISRAELLRMNQERLFSDNPKLTKSAITLIRLKQKVYDMGLYGEGHKNIEEYIDKAVSNGLSEQTFVARLKRGWSLNDALTKPLHYRP